MLCSLHDQYGELLDQIGQKKVSVQIQLKKAFLSLLPQQYQQYIDNVVFSSKETLTVIVWTKNSLISSELKMQEPFLRLQLKQNIGQEIKKIRFLACHDKVR